MLRAVTAGLACMVLGIYAGTELVRRKEMLQAWLLAMETMRIHCAFAREIPDEIFRAGAVHIPLLKEMISAKTMQEKRNYLQAQKVPAAMQSIVLPALQAIMNGTTQEQLQHVQLAASQIETLLREAQRKCERNAALYMTLGFWGGLCAALIFV